MITSQYPGYQGSAFGGLGGFANYAAPGGIDINGLSASIAQGVAQAAPAHLANALGGQQGLGNNLQPQSLLNFQASTPLGGLGLGLFDNQPQFGAFSGTGAGLAPQGFNFDFGHIIRTVAQSAAQALPGLLIGLLSSHPQLQQLARQGGAAGVGGVAGVAGVNPQSLFNPGASALGGVAPQGFNFDFGSIINTVAQSAAQALPGLLMSLLSAHPQLQQLTRQGGAGGVNPQSLINFGASTPFGNLGIGLFDNKPQAGALGGLAPQGIDFGEIIRNVAQNAAQALPNLLANLLATHPQTQQLAVQGLDLGAIARNVAGILAPQIPGLVHNVLGAVLRGTATVH